MEMNSNRQRKGGKWNTLEPWERKPLEDKQMSRKDIRRKMKNPSNGKQKGLFIFIGKKIPPKKEPSHKDTLISKHHIDGVKAICKNLQDKRVQGEGFEPKSTSQ